MTSTHELHKAGGDADERLIASNDQRIGGSSYSYFNPQSSVGGSAGGSGERDEEENNGFYQKYKGEFVPPEHKYIEHEKFGSAFFKDNCEEEYAIQRAFQPGNFTYLRKLPDQIQRNCILNGRMERVKDQMEQEAIGRQRNPVDKEILKQEKLKEVQRAKIGTLGYFEIFPYQESDYELPKKLSKLERLENEKKRKDVSELEFRPAGFDKKMKHEDPFRYVDRLESTTGYCGNSQYLFPFHLPEDVYDAYHESERRQKLITAQMKVAGQFIPSKTVHSLQPTSKARLPQILNEIQFYFKKFFKDQVGYFIGVNKRDYIQIMFEDKYLEDRKVQMVLSGMLEHEILSKFVLRRNLHRWGILNHKTGYLEYVILPPWVKDPDELLKAPLAKDDDGKQSCHTR